MIAENNQSFIEVPAISLPDFAYHNNINFIDLLKLDIEGSETDVLLSLNSAFISKIGQITVEFHDFIIENQKIEIKQIISKLKSNGFVMIRASYKDYSDTLFINSKKNKLSFNQLILIKIVQFLTAIKSYKYN